MSAVSCSLQSGRNDRPLLIVAGAIAVALHVGVLLLVVLPEVPTPDPVTRESSDRSLRYIPIPPPPVAPPTRQSAARTERRAPVPDQLARSYEPAREPSPEIAPVRLAALSEPPLGSPTPLPATTPDPRTRGLVPAELISETRVEPDYPAAARIGRREGRVVLRAEILPSGEIGRIEVLRCDRPGLGFEEEAAAAVGRWRYRAATLDGRPVSTFVTVHVDFSLH